MPATLTLEAPAPAWLEARIDAADARKVVRSRQESLEMMESTNRLHADEVAAKSRTGGGPLITNGTAAARGSGSGFEVVYYRCQCSGFPPSECHHDPTESPYPADIIAAGRAAIDKAETALEDAEATLADTPASFDCFAAAKAENARYIWWPMDQRRDPRLYRHRGQIVTQTELTGLGPHGLRHAIAKGGILEVDS